MKCERRIIYALARILAYPRCCGLACDAQSETEKPKSRLLSSLSRRPRERKRRGGRNKIRVICLSFPGPASKQSSVRAAENECGCGFKDAGAINCTSLARATTPKTALLRLYVQF
jgi:hypothetical protein